MKGFVETPPKVVDLMVAKLFRNGGPNKTACILDPGCGRGAFVDGILRYCNLQGMDYPRISAVDLNPDHVEFCRDRFRGYPNVSVHFGDFLGPHEGTYDYIIGNPPYVSIAGLSSLEKQAYRRTYRSAVNRFDLYILFFEKAVQLLREDGRLVFITPEKFAFTSGAARIRSLLSSVGIEELHYLAESTFGELVTYPLVTTLDRRFAGRTTVLHRNNGETTVRLSQSGASWLPEIAAAANGGASYEGDAMTLSQASDRISCGVATGADAVFVVKNDVLTDSLRAYAYPTISGRQLRTGFEVSHSMLVPYNSDATLIEASRLGALGEYLEEPGRRGRLLARTCVARKPWYSFHETPPLREMLRPKILCKDIAPTPPHFVADLEGSLVPRHSVYYIVPKHEGDLPVLLEFLNSMDARIWFSQNCQRAANGYLRLQSHILKRLPLPEGLPLRATGDLFQSASA